MSFKWTRHQRRKTSNPQLVGPDMFLFRRRFGADLGKQIFLARQTSWHSELGVNPASNWNKKGLEKTGKRPRILGQQPDPLLRTHATTNPGIHAGRCWDDERGLTGVRWMDTQLNGPQGPNVTATGQILAL